MQILTNNLKTFIESYIEDIEKEDFRSVFEASLEWLSDDEFKQFYDILLDLEFPYDIDDFIFDLIYDKCRDIIRRNDGEYICIEDEWSRISCNYLGKKNSIIEQFDDFEFDIKHGYHYCTVYY